MDQAILTRRARAAGPRPRQRVVPHMVRRKHEAITLHADFSCPWSYLAWRRAAVLEAAGVTVDWRAVEHSPWTPSRADDRAERLTGLQAEMDHVLGALLPGEELPYDLAGFVPRTRAAVAAYAEAYVAGVPERVRRLVFEAFWMHGIDIGDAVVLRALIADELRGGSSPSEVVREWGYPVDVTGGPISTDAWRLVRTWDLEWHGTQRPVVPVLQVGDRRPVLGADAVDWLGREIRAHGLGHELPAPTPPDAPSPEGLPGRAWMSQHGGRWLWRSQVESRVAAGH